MKFVDIEWYIWVILYFRCIELYIGFRFFFFYLEMDSFLSMFVIFFCVWGFVNDIVLN